MGKRGYRSVLRSLLMLAFAGSLLGPNAAEGQRARIMLTPFVAGFVPLSVRGSATATVSGIQQTVELKQQAVPAFGVRFGYQSRGPLGVEGTYFFAGSNSRISLIAGGQSFGTELDGNIQGGSVKASYRLTDSRTDTDFFLSAGVSGTKHDGDFFTSTRAQDQFDVGGVVGAGLHIAMSPQVTLRVEGDLNLYKWSQFRILPSKTQADFLLTAGLGLRLGR